MAAELHISISAEKILEVGGFGVTNSILTSLISSAILIILALSVYGSLQYSKNRGPKGLQNIFEMIVEALRKLTADVTGSEALTKSIFPLAATFFLWILVNNWIGLLPGVGTIGLIEEPHAVADVTEVYAAEEIVVDDSTVANPVADSQVDDSEHAEETSKESIFVPLLRAGTADLNTTLALALIAMGAVQYLGIKHLGLGYFKKFINFKGPIDAFVGILETVSEISKVISFAFRLFGNIFAGEVLLAVIAFITPVFLKPFSTIPFLMLEIFVGVIQALVFAMLTIVFMSMATISHGDDH